MSSTCLDRWARSTRSILGRGLGREMERGSWGARWSAEHGEGVGERDGAQKHGAQVGERGGAPSRSPTLGALSRKLGRYQTVGAPPQMDIRFFRGCDPIRCISECACAMRCDATKRPYMLERAETQQVSGHLSACANNYTNIVLLHITITRIRLSLASPLDHTWFEDRPSATHCGSASLVHHARTSVLHTRLCGSGALTGLVCTQLVGMPRRRLGPALFCMGEGLSDTPSLPFICSGVQVPGAPKVKSSYFSAH